MIGTLLCALASSANARAHYIEIWNPPEARASRPHAHTPRKPLHAHHRAPHKLVTRRVAQPAERAPAPGAATPGYKRSPLLPPQLGPDGKVLQVRYDITT